MPKHATMHPYRNLGIMTALSFVAMYILMYAMVDAVDSVYMSFNQVYMAALMAAPMVLIELLVMKGMYPDQTLNRVLIGASIVALAAFFLLIRQQTAIGDRQFLRSMIPHHSGAILMCDQTGLQRSDVRELCKQIIASQQKEIDQMKRMLAEPQNQKVGLGEPLSGK